MASRHTHQEPEFFNNYEDRRRITRIEGEVKSLRTEAWTNDKNNNKRNEPLSKQMERKLSKFSRSQKPTSLQAWVSDKKLPNGWMDVYFVFARMVLEVHLWRGKHKITGWYITTSINL